MEGIPSEKAIIKAPTRNVRPPPTKKRFKVKIDEKLCKGCYFCIRFCPMGVLVRSDLIGELGYNIARVEFPEKCTGCKACLLYCPDFAIVVEEETEKD